MVFPYFPCQPANKLLSPQCPRSLQGGVIRGTLCQELSEPPFLQVEDLPSEPFRGENQPRHRPTFSKACDLCKEQRSFPNALPEGKPVKARPSPCPRLISRAIVTELPLSVELRQRSQQVLLRAQSGCGRGNQSSNLIVHEVETHSFPQSCLRFIATSTGDGNAP